MGNFRYLVGYCSWREGVSDYYERNFETLRHAGFDVEGICITLTPPGPRLSWDQLDHGWRTGSTDLFSLYGNLLDRLRHRDVFINLHGANLHPEFVRMLPTFNVFVCNDDPESSEDLSMPVAWAYDLCLVGNIAEVRTYRRWGIKNVYFQPMGFSDQDVLSTVTEESILRNPREHGVVLFCERESAWRRARLERVVEAFPDGVFRGRGWPGGFIPKEDRLSYYGKAKIGINIHNSTGPINARTYELPANGVMQICDNKSHLGKIFELDREVVGFDTIGECIEKVRYYLEHDAERREIAARGFRRAWRDYHLVPCWKRLDELVSSLSREPRPERHWPDLRSIRLASKIHKASGGVLDILQRIKEKVFPVVLSVSPADVPRAKPDVAISYQEIWPRYKCTKSLRHESPGIKLGILKGQAREYEHYVRACQEMDVHHAVIDLTADGWLEQVIEEECDGYLARPPHWTTVWREIYLERVFVIANQLNKFVFPSLLEMTLYENKKMMSYWMKVNNVPHPPTRVFVNQREALAFARTAVYPIVFKTSLGSAGSGVRILNDFAEAERIIVSAFDTGIVRTPGDGRDRQWGYVIFQDYIRNAREFRIIRIGDSFFGHEKLAENGMHSGSNLVGWGAPPGRMLDLAYDVSERGQFNSMDFDVFMDEDHNLYVNELQCVFGSYNPSQMYIDDRPGRYRKFGGEWLFEEGLFCQNGCANLRVETALSMMNRARSKW